MRILIVSEYVAPVRAVASLRWTKLGKYLKATCGCQVDLLTNRKCFDGSVADAQHYEYDETIAPDLEYFDRIYEIPDAWSGRFLMKAAAFVKSFLPRDDRGVPALSKKELTKRPQNESSASSQTQSPAPSFADKFYGRYLAYLERQRVGSVEEMRLPLNDYDVIISTYSPKWPHLVAEKLKTKQPGIQWIADYRDAVTDSDSRNTTENRSFARLHTSTADFVLGVSDAVIDRLDIDPGQNRHVIPHGYDASDLQMRSRKPSDRFVVSYTGTLYHDSNYVSDLTPAFAVLQGLIEDGAVSRDDVLVVYCGLSSGEFATQASRYPLVPVADEGFVARERAMEVQDGSSLLIYTTCNNDIYESDLTGKTYEYLSSNVPILALCSGNKPGARTSTFFRNAGAGFAYEEACKERDFPLMRAFVEGAYRDWKKNGLTTAKTDWSYVETNDYARLAQDLYELIDGSENDTYEMRGAK